MTNCPDPKMESRSRLPELLRTSVRHPEYPASPLEIIRSGPAGHPYEQPFSDSPLLAAMQIMAESRKLHAATNSHPDPSFAGMPGMAASHQKAAAISRT